MTGTEACQRILVESLVVRGRDEINIHTTFNIYTAFLICLSKKGKYVLKSISLIGIGQFYHWRG